MFDQEAEVRRAKITIFKGGFGHLIDLKWLNFDTRLILWWIIVYFISLQKSLFMESALNRMDVGPPASSAQNH